MSESAQLNLCDQSTQYSVWKGGIASGSGYQEVKLMFRRTFLSWLHFAVVLGGLAVGLLNFGDKVSSLDFLMETTKLNGQVGKISAAMYTVIGKSSAA
jgi:hypothetical protein